MKNRIYRLLLVCFLAILFLPSCSDRDVDYLFDGSVNERFEKLKTDYVKVFTSAENGWIGYYSPNAKVGGFVLLMKFDDKGNVEMASDYEHGNNDNKTTYRIDKTLKIQLVFESHGILQKIYETGRNGVNGEYVFFIKSVKDDEIILESATDFGYDGSGITELKLTKAKPEYWNLKPIYENSPKLANGYLTDKYFRAMYVEGSGAKKAFSYVEGYDDTKINRYAIVKGENSEGQIVSEKVSIAVTYDGMKFIKPYTINGKEVSDFKYDETNNRFVSSDGGQKTIIEHVDAAPVVYYPAVSIGADGKIMENLYFHSRWFPSLKTESSPSFSKIYAESKLQRFYIQFNSNADDRLAEKHDAVLLVRHPYFALKKDKYKAIPLKVKRIANERIIFIPEDNLEKYVPEQLPREDIKAIYKMLTDSDGFHVESIGIGSPFGAFQGSFFIGVKKSNIRFPLIDAALKPA